MLLLAVALLLLAGGEDTPRAADPAPAQGSPDRGESDLPLAASAVGRGRTPRAFGRLPIADEAAGFALGWLAANQGNDGDWDSSIGATSLAILAFLSEGETHQRGNWKRVVREGLRFLKQHQNASGRFGSLGDRSPNVDHALATLAMCEAYALTGSPLFKQSAQMGLDHTASIGERWVPFLVWASLAVACGRDCGLGVDGAVLGWKPHYPPDDGRSLRARNVLRTVIRGRSEELESPNFSEELAAVASGVPGRYGEVDPETWFLATAVVFEGVPSEWGKWIVAMNREIVRLQVRDGPSSGSWDPPGPLADHLGRAETTALMTMTLGFYHRGGRVFGSSDR